MLIQHSANAAKGIADPAIASAIEKVSVDWLRGTVETMAIPRNYEHEADNNRFIGMWIAEQLRAYGFDIKFQGEWSNVIARTRLAADAPCILVGAHYDSVPGTPGADDNASAVAAMLACAKAVAERGLIDNVCFVSFNREEDGFLGSADFVKQAVAGGRFAIREAHILEMVGYCDHRAGSQRVPTGLPIEVPDGGDFLGILANQSSSHTGDRILRTAKTYCPAFPVLSLSVQPGMEKVFPVLARSDHVPFWKASVPAVMWTDTAEFRNPHYHQPTDVPASLDYEFLLNVVRLLVATVVS